MLFWSQPTGLSNKLIFVCHFLSRLFSRIVVSKLGLQSWPPTWQKSCFGRIKWAQRGIFGEFRAPRMLWFASQKGSQWGKSPEMFEFKGIYNFSWLGLLHAFFRERKLRQGNTAAAFRAHLLSLQDFCQVGGHFCNPNLNSPIGKIFLNEGEGKYWFFADRHRANHTFLQMPNFAELAKSAPNGKIRHHSKSWQS